MPISRLADSGPSEAWTRFICWLELKSPRIVPGSAFSPLVAPTMSRTTRIASGPSTIMATTGPPVINASSSGIPSLLDVLGIVPLGQFGRDPHQLHGDDVQSLVLEPGDDAAHQPPLRRSRASAVRECVPLSDPFSRDAMERGYSRGSMALAQVVAAADRD